MSFPSSPLDLRVEIHVAGEWLDITEDVLTEQDIVITRGRADWATDVDPGSASLVLDNRGGKYSTRNPRGPHFGKLTRNTPIRIGVRHGDQTLWRFCGEVAAWPTRWDLSQSMSWAPIEAAGVLRRLQASAGPPHSVYRRFIEAEGPRAYWPLTDGPQTQNGRAAVRGNITYTEIRDGDRDAPMRFGNYTIADWLEPIAETPEKTTRGLVRGYVRGANRPDEWAVDFIRAGMGGMDSFSIEAGGEGTNADPSLFWHVGFDHTNQTVYVSVTTIGATQSSTGMMAQPQNRPRAFDEAAHMYRLEMTRVNASSSRWRLYMDGVSIATGTTSVSRGVPIRWRYEWFTPDDQTATPVALGHVAVWDARTAPAPAELLVALHGNAGETTGERIARVCEEADVPVSFIGDPADTQLVGPQEMASPLECVISAANADGGTVQESRDDLTLVYRTNRSRYNRGALLED